MNENTHLTEQELVLLVDGELPARRKIEAGAHLESCWSCRERSRALEETIADFVRARNTELPSATGPRALLRARLAEEAATSQRFPWPKIMVPAGAFAAVAIAILIFQTTVNAEGPKPKSSFTPGETRPITLQEVCMNSNAEVISRDIPENKQQQVFAEYGIKSPRAGEFEVDYLITPDLGGTESIRNLWPQPYSARWNAKTKDQLEQRLHELVCSGKLDLATAQHDIAVDWIGAYKKYMK
jgi:hypothetical protein